MDVHGTIPYMEAWTKLYQRILASSVWRLPSDIRVVWITILALKDENGCVFGTVGWLADQARVEIEVCREAIEIFKAPDERSRTADNDGRKIAEIQGGWSVLNHQYYRDGIEDIRDRWKKQKKAQRARKAVKDALAAGGSLSQVVHKLVNEDPITKADKASKRSDEPSESGVQEG